MPNEIILETQLVRKQFGALVAVDDVSLQVQAQTFHSIIGPNGAGKTTFFNLLSGNLEPTSGKIFYKGDDITHHPVHRTAHLGIGRSFQITNIFPDLTVFENIRLAAQALGKDNYKFYRPASAFPTYEERAREVIKQVGLTARAESLARTLPHGDQRKLELGMLLAPDPEVLLLDEPTAGMAAEQVPELIDLIQEVQAAGGKTVMLVEHNMNVVMSVSDVITVMHMGAVLAEGTPVEIAANETVQEAYLGGLYELGGKQRKTALEKEETMATDPNAAPLLSVQAIHTFIGQFHILEGVSVDVPKGSIVALLGRNGAGKTTTLKSILGMTPPSQGKVIFDGEEIQGRRSFEIAAMGIGFVPEHRAIFRDLSVAENLKIAERQKGDLERKEDLIFGLFPDLKRLIKLPGTNLSGGQQQMLAVARALVPDNRLLLIDEPTEGLAPVIIEQMMAAIAQLSADTTVLLVEQNFIVASNLAESYVIIEEGRSVKHGKMADLVDDKETIHRYLGAA